MAWEFERVAGPFEGSAGGVIWDSTRDQVLFSTVDEGRLLWLDHASKAVSEFRRYANRVNGLARGPNGEIYGAQEGGRRLVEFTPDGRTVAVDALLDGKYHNQPSDLVVDRQHSIYFTDPRHAVIPFGPSIFHSLTTARCCALNATTAAPGRRRGSPTTPSAPARCCSRTTRARFTSPTACRVRSSGASCVPTRSAPTARSSIPSFCTFLAKIIAASIAESKACALIATATSSRSAAGNAAGLVRWCTFLRRPAR